MNSGVFVPIVDQLSMLQKTWDGLKRLPGGGVLFGRLVGRLAPYTGTIKPEVVDLRRGRGRVRMKDRRKVRNHLDSIHAIALMNLAEVCSGLTFTYSLPARTKAIVTGLQIDYVKKARGTLTAECFCVIPQTNEADEYDIDVVTRDETDEVVTRMTARWLVGPL